MNQSWQCKNRKTTCCLVSAVVIFNVTYVFAAPILMRNLCAQFEITYDKLYTFQVNFQYCVLRIE